MNRTDASIFVLLAFCLLASGNLSAQLLGKKGDAFDISGKVLDLEGEGVGDVEVILNNADGKEVGSETTKKRIGKGNFEFSKISPGTYTVSASGDVGEASQEVVVEDDDGDAIGIKHMMILSLGFDHRLIDGAGGAKFIAKIKDNLENMNFKDLI